MRVGAASLAAVVLALASAATPVAAEPVAVVSTGVDLVSVALDGDTMSLRFRDEQAVGRDPAEVVLGPDGGLAGRVPAGPAFAFLGKPGHAVWALFAGDTGFPALDTTGVRPGVVVDDRVTLTLGSVEGPGTFTAYTLAGLGAATPLFGNGADLPRSTQLPAGSRTDGVVWAFDAAGEYRFTLTGSAALRSGATVRAEATYRVHVPAIEPAEPAVPAPMKQAAQPRAEAAEAFAAPKPAAVPKPAARRSPPPRRRRRPCRRRQKPLPVLVR